MSLTHMSLSNFVLSWILSQKCIFVGYCENTKGYRLINPSKPLKIIKSRDVIFDEASIGRQSQDSAPCTSSQIVNVEKQLASFPLIESSPSKPQIHDLPPQTPAPHGQSAGDSESDSDSDFGIANIFSDEPWHPLRNRKLPAKFADYH